MKHQWLRWLPEPAEGDLDDLRSIVRGDIDLARLEQLACCEWDSSGLRLLARCASQIMDSPELLNLARARGFGAINLVVFSNASTKHHREALVGTGLRHKMLVRPMIVEYEEPEAFIAREGDVLRAFGPDVFMINQDAKFLNQSSDDLGSEQAAEIAATYAVNRLRSLRSTIRQEFGKSVLLQTVAPDPMQSRHSMDVNLAGSHGDVVRRINQGIAALAKEFGDPVLDVAGLAQQVGLDNWFSGRYWMMAKYTISPELVPLYADCACKWLAVLAGKSRRALVLDLDNTLWGGIVGDDGKENLALGSGDVLGEAHQAVQAMAKSLHQRGVLLCLSSKNEEAVALDAFRSHPEMVLSEADITTWRINWTDKAENIKSMAEELNLGLSSFVFIDDNPVERQRVRNALPDVAVPELPKDVTEWVPIIQAASYFESLNFSLEDTKRADFYKQNAVRAKLENEFVSHDDFLTSLSMVMDVRPFDAAGRLRIAQLIAKSNQFNLTTRRYSADEVAALELDQGVLTFQVRLRDNFGDNGMIAVVIARIGDAQLEIDTWLMSCRVLGRRIEEKILDVIVERARELRIPKISAVYIPTSKNMMVRDHYSRLGFVNERAAPDGMTHWNLCVDEYVAKNPPIDLAGQQFEH